MNKSINIEDYDYPLPDERIAKFPLPKRDESKLLVYRGGEISHRPFKTIGEVLPEGTLLIFNNTKVFRARIVMHKPSGARIEIFCLEPYEPADYERAFAARGQSRWLCLVGNLKRWKEGLLSIPFDLGGKPCTLTAERGEAVGTAHAVKFSWNADCSFGQLVEHLGRTPIPPYLGRESEAVDDVRYQTVYSVVEGSVAAPTAGLHFTPELLKSLRADGIETAFVTLHVGAGTFLPVKESDAMQHSMHVEHFSIEADMLRRMIARLGHIIAVGTTSVRTIESLGALGYRVLQHGSPDCERPVGQWEIYDIPAETESLALLKVLSDYMEANKLDTLKASTQIMITPSYRFRFTSGMVTNFHQPKSTLLLLVAAAVGDDWHRIYRYAMDNDFRFLSYGDSSLLLG